MRTANDAKKETEKNTNETEKQLTTLLTYFDTKVADSSKLGKRTIDPLKLMKSQLPGNVLTELEKKLKSLGYNFSYTYHNAEQTYSINLSW